MKSDLELWAHLNQVADNVQQLGALPAEEREELKAVREKVKKAP